MLRIDLQAAGIPYAVEGADGLLFAEWRTMLTIAENCRKQPHRTARTKTKGRHHSGRVKTQRMKKADDDCGTMPKVKYPRQGSNL